MSRSRTWDSDVVAITQLVNLYRLAVDSQQWQPRITRRICRITWWTGDPFVNETTPGVKFDLATSVFARQG